MVERRPEDRDTWRDFAGQVGHKEARKLRARRERRRSPMFWMGMFGLVGWAVAVPTVIGIYVGVKLDQWRDDPISWTLSGIVIGVALGCLNAWYWVKRESRMAQPHEPGEDPE